MLYTFTHASPSSTFPMYVPLRTDYSYFFKPLLNFPEKGYIEIPFEFKNPGLVIIIFLYFSFFFL
jgi:hypothetical protein